MTVIPVSSESLTAAEIYSGQALISSENEILINSLAAKLEECGAVMLPPLVSADTLADMQTALSDVDVILRRSK